MARVDRAGRPGGARSPRRDAARPGGVRQRGGLSRALSRAAASRRGPGVRRRPRGRRAPARARVLDPAPPSEARRGVAGARPRPAPPSAASPRRRWRARGPSATSTRGRWSSWSTPRGALLLPRDEHAAPGRAPGDRGGDRPRPRGGAAAGGGRRARCRGVRRRSPSAARRSSVRVYAEDPDKGFLPSPGTIARLDAAVRRGDSRGVRRGGRAASVSVHYDPLLFKLIARGRARATRRSRACGRARRDCASRA